MTALDSGPYFHALRAFGEAHPARAVVVISGHWEEGPPIRAASSALPPMIYDFSGFPRELYEVNYPAPGEPALAERVVSLLASSGVQAQVDPRRGFDHGVWTPLRMLFPEAQVPVIPLSLPVARDPRSLFALGATLKTLREEQVWILGSGGIVHNLYQPRPGSVDAPVEEWAAQFDNWVQARIDEGDIGALFEYRQAAPFAARAVPTTDHFDPLFVMLGAGLPGAGQDGTVERTVERIYEGFQYGHMSLRCLAFV